MKLKDAMKIFTCDFTVVNLTNPENEDIKLKFLEKNLSFLVPVTYEKFSPLYDYTVTEITKNSSNEVIVFVKDI